MAITRSEDLTPVGSVKRASFALLFLCLGALSFGGSFSDAVVGGSSGIQTETASSDAVSTAGWHLFVNGERFIIMGVCYNPVPIGSTQRSWDTLDEDILLMQEAGINTIRTYSPIEAAWVLDRLAAAGIKVIMGITSGSGTYNIQNGGYLTYIDTFKSHEAILMWELGNEYNYHPEWFGGDVNNWYEMLENAAQEIHLIDSDHPVSTAHGELPSAATLAAVPSVDVWGMNVYRWDYSHTAITDFAAISDKPCYLSETGGDSYNTAPSHPTYPIGVNEQMQADATEVIVNGVVSNLDHGSGVTLFEFSDEWWKAGDPSTQDPGGWAPYSSGVPYDGAPNEEYWGIVDVFRTEKLAFDILKNSYTAPICLVSANAGTEQYLHIGSTSTTLDGSASSYSGPLTYEWTQTAGPTAADFSSQFVEQPLVSNLVAGDYTFRLTVTGDCGTSTDTVNVVVTETENVVPIAIAGPDQVFSPGTTSARINGSGSFDPDNGPAGLTYLWRQTAGPTLRISGSTLAAPKVAGFSDSGSYTFELVVFDGLDWSTPSTVTLFGTTIFVDGFESGGTTNW